MTVLIVKTLSYLSLLVPVRLAGAVGAGLGRLFYIILGRHRNITLRNLERIYPEKDLAWRIRVAHESFAELGRTIFETPYVFLRSRQYLLSHIEFSENKEVLEALEADKGVIVTGCHYSNWELMALYLSMLGQPCSMIYRKLPHETLDQLLKSWRERFGNILHSRRESIRWIPQKLKAGENLALLVDQHLSNGVPVPFLGHEAQSTVMPAMYARKHNIPVFAGVLHRQGRSFRFRGNIIRVQFPPKSDDANKDLVTYSECLYDSFAPAIHARPECWLWLHRRWLYLDDQEQV